MMHARLKLLLTSLMAVRRLFELILKVTIKKFGLYGQTPDFPLKKTNDVEQEKWDKFFIKA